jgi:hypothetical protein
MRITVQGVGVAANDFNADGAMLEAPYQVTAV